MVRVSEADVPPGQERLRISSSNHSSQKRFHEPGDVEDTACPQLARSDRNWKVRKLIQLIPFYSPCPKCYPDGHAGYERLMSTDGRAMTDGSGMERITVRIPGFAREQLDALVDAGEFKNRSQAVRKAIHKLDGVGEDRRHMVTGGDGCE